jgi:hypothetical protein
MNQYHLTMDMNKVTNLVLELLSASLLSLLLVDELHQHTLVLGIKKQSTRTKNISVQNIISGVSGALRNN